MSDRATGPATEGANRVIMFRRLLPDGSFGHWCLWSPSYDPTSEVQQALARAETELNRAARHFNYPDEYEVAIFVREEAA